MENENPLNIPLHLNKSPSQPHSAKEKEQLLNRLKRIEGQVRGLQKMVDENRYCVDILVQITAVQAALKNVGFSLLEHHTKTCVADSIRSGDEKEVIDELMKVVKQYAK